MASVNDIVEADPEPQRSRVERVVEWFQYYIAEYGAYAGMFAVAYVMLLILTTALMHAQRLFTSLTILRSFEHASLCACTGTPIVIFGIMVTFGYQDWKMYRTFPGYLREKATEGIIGFVICCGVGYALILAGTAL